MSRNPGDLILKDPQSIEPQGFDWTLYLADLSDAETISASTWSVSGGETVPLLTLSSPTIVTGNKKTQVKLNAGTLGYRYVVTNHVTTSGGTQDDRSFPVLIQNR